MHHHPLSDRRLWSTTVIWGMNDPSVGKPQHSFLVESDWQGPALSPYGRLEIVQKPGHDLQISGAEDELFNVGALTLGLAFSIPILENWETSAALQGTAYRVAEALRSDYGDHPWSIGIHLQLSPHQEMEPHVGMH